MLTMLRCLLSLESGVTSINGLGLAKLLALLFLELQIVDSVSVVEGKRQ
jgi:hypothetical protein